ncbi:MAG: hypothetical protein IJX78_04700 [Bacilli bacterium]|nr:hypothetical protein [Bacilli bacterium]
MRKNRLALPTVFASIGALFNIVISYMIAYFATGGTFFNGALEFDFGNMWLVVTIMAMVAPILSLIGALILSSAPRTAGFLLIVSALEYVVVGLMAEMEAVPYLLFFSIGAVILLVTGIYCTAAHYVTEQYHIDYSKTKAAPREEARAHLAENKNH